MVATSPESMYIRDACRAWSPHVHQHCTTTVPADSACCNCTIADGGRTSVVVGRQRFLADVDRIRELYYSHACVNAAAPAAPVGPRVALPHRGIQCPERSIRFGVAQGRRSCAEDEAIAHVHMHATDIGTTNLRAVNVLASAARSPHAYICRPPRKPRPRGEHLELSRLQFTWFEVLAIDIWGPLQIFCIHGRFLKQAAEGLTEDRVTSGGNHLHQCRYVRANPPPPVSVQLAVAVVLQVFTACLPQLRDHCEWFRLYSLLTSSWVAHHIQLQFSEVTRTVISG